MAGAEIPGWRTLLHERGVRHMAMSYVGLARRTKFARPWLVAEKFPAETSVFLDSGAHTANKSQDQDVDELVSLTDRYMTFVEANVSTVDVVTEFDALALPAEIRAKNRDRLHELLGDRFLPVWHIEDGAAELGRLADVYGRVGVMQTVLDGRDLTRELRNLARGGVRLHGVAMTQIDAMREIQWDSVSSTSWLSPSMYGDTIVWTGRELKRYPRTYKAQARKRHRTLFRNVGLDAEAIDNDDPTEILKLSIWSWTEYVDSLNQQTHMM